MYLFAVYFLSYFGYPSAYTAAHFHRLPIFFFMFYRVKLSQSGVLCNRVTLNHGEQKTTAFINRDIAPW